MYTRKTYHLNETQLKHIQELVKSPAFVTLCEWAEWEYSEGCKYGWSLIPFLNTQKEEDIQTLEKEYYANEAIVNWLSTIKMKGSDYIGTPV